MSKVSRRKALGLIGMAPLAGSVLTAGHATPDASAAGVTTSDRARRRIQERHLPNISLITQDGKRVRFYDDLVKDKVVSLNFFYANCDKVCPVVMAHLAKVQNLLGSRLGRDIFMYSFTLKPEEDTIDVLKRTHHMYGAKPGWTYLTANPKDMESLRVAIGFTYPDPAIDQDKEQHIGNIRYGNEPLMLWSACPGMARPGWIAETLQWVINPESFRGQKA